MKRFLSYSICFLACVVLIFPYSGTAHAEDSVQKSEYSPVVIDSSGDQLSYGEIVAALNRQSEEVVTGQSVPDESGKKGGEQVKAF